MALQKLVESGYGQLELNLVAFPRTGAIVAQYKAGTTFTDKTGDDKYLENGMLLKVDGVERTVEKEAPEANTIYALNYSTEHMYDERTYALKDFRLDSTNDFYPRLGYLTQGDKFTTNTVCYEDGDYANADAIKTAIAAGQAFGGACDNGYIMLTKEAAANGPVLRAVAFTTMPDGQKAIKFEVIKG